MTRSALGRLPSLLFVVISSRMTRRVARKAHYTWCRGAGASCHFYADQPFGSTQPRMAWTTLHARPPRGGCCKRAGDFFCSPHRNSTLVAQYRYLPALLHARQSAAFARADWVVLVDDDSYVFVQRLRMLLARYDTNAPIMLGEFKASSSPYACGGAGAVLSRAAMGRLDLRRCAADHARRCMQSDWAVAWCARAAEVRFDGRHGCGSCAVANPGGTVEARLRAGCHFLQEGARWRDAVARLASNHSPSIVHGYAPRPADGSREKLVRSTASTARGVREVV